MLDERNRCEAGEGEEEEKEEEKEKEKESAIERANDINLAFTLQSQIQLNPVGLEGSKREEKRKGKIKHEKRRFLSSICILCVFVPGTLPPRC
jgi:hypothetical protein